MKIQYIGKRPKLEYDPPWLLGGPYIFDVGIDSGVCEVHPADGREMVAGSPKTFILIEDELPELLDPGFEESTIPVIDEQTSQVVEEEAPQQDTKVADVIAALEEELLGGESAEESEVQDTQGENLGPWECPICGKVYVREESYRKHMIAKHPEVGTGGR